MQKLIGAALTLCDRLAKQKSGDILDYINKMPKIVRNFLPEELKDHPGSFNCVKVDKIEGNPEGTHIAEIIVDYALRQLLKEQFEKDEIGVHLIQDTIGVITKREQPVDWQKVKDFISEQLAPQLRQDLESAQKIKITEFVSKEKQENNGYVKQENNGYVIADPNNRESLLRYVISSFNYPDDIKSGKFTTRGTFLEEDSGIDINAVRVTGSAIQDVLVNTLGMNVLTPPPKGVRR